MTLGDETSAYEEPAGDVGPRPDGPPPCLPARFGRYVRLGLLGAGGMGQVFTAFDTELARRVAIKILAVDRGRVGINAQPRLRREARALAKLAHPNVVAIYDVGEVDGSTFVAMELVEGQTLGAWQRERARPWSEVVRAYAQAGEGLAAAHAQGLVHRDFKPDNAIIDRAGRVRVLDFGLAVVAGPRPDSTPGKNAEISADPRLTITGAMLGTPAYMAPEQLRGEAADARSDQFSFCVALYEALCGERPFAGGTVGELRAAAAAGELRSQPVGRRVPPRIRRALARGLAAQPDERWPDMRALLGAIGRRRGGLRRIAPVLAVVGLAGAGALSLMPPTGAGDDPCEAAAAAIDDAWGPGRRAAVRAAILKSGMPYAEQAWARVEPGLDDYAKRWATERRAACEAGRREAQSGQPDERATAHARACLYGDHEQFRALVEVLEQADGGVVSKAASAVGHLPDPARCRQSTPTAAPPDTPEVEALRASLYRAHANELAGRYAQASTQAGDVAQQARTMDHAALLAEARLRQGIALDRDGAYAEAETALSEAAMLAVEHGLDSIAAEASVELTGVVGYERVRFEDGLSWGRHAAAAVQRADASPPLRARLANNLGATYDRQGKLEQAREQYRAALAALEGAQGHVVEHQRANSLNNLGNAEARLSRGDEARQHLGRAVATIERLRGESHPDVGLMLINLANLELDYGDLSIAEGHHRRALQISTDALGPAHPIVSTCLLNLGMVLQAAGKPDEARVVLQRAVERFEQTVGPDHHRTAMALNNLGEALRDLGRPAEALALHRRTLEIWTAAHGPQHPVLAFAENNIGLALLAAGDPEQAEVYLGRALKRRDDADEVDPALRGCSRLGLARALQAREAAPAAVQALLASARQDLQGATGRYRREQQMLARWLNGDAPDRDAAFRPSVPANPPSE